MHLARFFLVALFLICEAGLYGQQGHSPVPTKLENPISETYLKRHLRKRAPRLVLNDKTERLLRKKLNSDPVVQNMYMAVKLNAETILDRELLQRAMVGRRLLATSREFLWRMNMLAMVYRIERDNRYLTRINDEVLAVCGFEDWNPAHFLDVAEMALGVALALDWTGGDLPEDTREKAINALIEKGIKPSWPSGEQPWWAFGNNNWNQVCNGGMIAASIVVAEVAPELAAKTIKRALDGLPNSLAEYGPDGVYPEGSTYWSYGTSFSVITIAMLESAFNTDFGLGDYPGFKESAIFRVLCNAPSGWYYNFADCGDQRSQNGDLILAWFAHKTGNAAFHEKDRFLMAPGTMGKLHRLGGASLVWLSQYHEEKHQTLPRVWKGEGPNPVVIFKGDENDPHQYYFGGKGGRGMVNHGNMDAGSFVFELGGIRWVIDPGNQPYHELESTGFDLWDRCQDCQRWTLLTKNNLGHSTLTINGKHHSVEGMVSLNEFQQGDKPSASFNMTAAFSGLVDGATRQFIKDGPASLVIRDEIKVNELTRQVTWQLITQAEVQFMNDHLVLSQQGKKLLVENLSHPGYQASVISLDPPPMALDRRIENLKRVEFNYPAYLFEEGNQIIEIRLSGE